MDAEEPKWVVRHKQVRDMVLNGCNYCKKEAEAGQPIDNVAKPQEQTQYASGIRMKIVQWILSEACKSMNNVLEKHNQRMAGLIWI